MKIFSSLLFLIGMGISVLSCQKKSDPPAPTKTDYISSSAWTYESGGVDFDKNGTIDFALAAGMVPTCQVDNSLSFKKDNTGSTDEGATKCNASDPQISSFNCNFADNEANLQISGNVFPMLNGKFKILALTTTSFSLSKDTVLSSQNVALIVNMKH